jgi:hypothetical protein
VDKSTFLGPFATSLGLELDSANGDEVTAHWTVTPEMHQPYGILHGGLLGGVQDGAVLDRCALPDHDAPEVRPEHRTGPDRRLGADPDVADDDRVRVDVGVRVDLRHE